MGELHETILIARDAASVWKTVGDPAGVAAWFPGIASSTVEGDIRHCVLADGAVVDERIVRIDNRELTLAYSVIAGMPVTRHLGTVKVTAVDDSSARLDYVTAVEPASFEKLLGASVHNALKNLKLVMESGA